MLRHNSPLFYAEARKKQEGNVNLLRGELCSSMRFLPVSLSCGVRYWAAVPEVLYLKITDVQGAEETCRGSPVITLAIPQLECNSTN